MPLFAALLATFVPAMQQEIDPNLLAIGGAGQLDIAPNQILNTATGRTANADAIAKAADGLNWVYLGENHATTAHQQLQADIIEALAKRGRKVIVGLEMLTRPKQPVLDLWHTTSVSESTFLQKIDWKKEWGFDYKFYRPIFQAAREYSLPMVALNVPRDWVRYVGRGGYGNLTDLQKQELPSEFFLGNGDHKQVFTALMGGHPLTGPQGDNMYAAQVLWDEGMADTALKVMKAKGDKNTVFVVVAGVGHVMYGQGINYRVTRRTGAKGITVSMLQGDEPQKVAKGLGDFVFMSVPEKKEAPKKG